LFDYHLHSEGCASSLDRVWYSGRARRWRGVVRYDAGEALAAVLSSFRLRTRF
jgi:hypothetical protein